MHEQDWRQRYGSRPERRESPLYLEESAASHLETRIPVARETETAGEVLPRLWASPMRSVDTVYVVDAEERLVGLLPLRELRGLAPERPVGEALQRHYPAVRPTDDQEHVAIQALRHELAAVPVVEESGRLLGVVPAEALLRILHHEHVEDLHRLAGIRRESAQARVAMEEPPMRRARHRLPWLLVGTVGSIVATLVMARFEESLRAHLAVAFFVPGIVYLADAIGTQTEAVTVRFLSLSRGPSFRRMLFGEMRTGLFIGLTLAALVFPLTALAVGTRLALAVSLALLAAGTMATSIGLFFPWLLYRLGRDPAFGAGPVATVLQDVLSLLIYFMVVTLLVTG
jgi:magnesium transporter